MSGKRKHVEPVVEKDIIEKVKKIKATKTLVEVVQENSADDSPVKKSKSKKPKVVVVAEEEEPAQIKKLKPKKTNIDVVADPKAEEPEHEIGTTVIHMTPAEYRKEHEITVSNADADKFPLFQRFEESGFPEKLLSIFSHSGFTAPSPIQAQAWPIALAGSDLLGIAKTGSGKTLGYLLPAFTHILTQLKSKPLQMKAPRLLVMAPTRELAVQIHEEAVKFGRVLGIKSTAIYGGSSKGPQIQALNAGVHCVIGTPGRVTDMMQMKGWDGKTIMTLGDVTVLVLDEADRMLDMGFEPVIREIIAALPPRQTMFFTATWPKTVQRVAYDILKPDGVQINLGNSNEELVANKDVKQLIEFVRQSDKMEMLNKIIKKASADADARIIVFCNKKIDVQAVADELFYAGMKTDAIHGDKSQMEREHILKQFKKGDLHILIASDVAARGLDIKGVDMVVNYDMPRSIEDYVHRIGRTGRAGVKGIATSFFDIMNDKQHAKDLVKIMKDAGSEVPEKLNELVPRRGFGGGRGGSAGRGRGGYRGGGGGGYRRSY